MAEKKKTEQVNFLDAYQGILNAQQQSLPATFDSLMQTALRGMSGERTGAIKFLEKDGMRAREAAFKANPELEKALGFYTRALGEEADASGPDRLLGILIDKASAAGPSEISKRLESAALRDLDLGGALSPEEEEKAIQAARAGFSARGMVHGNPALIAEVLARDDAARIRERERQSFAGAVNAQLLGEENANRGFQTNVRSLEGQHLTNLQGGVATTAAVDPAMHILDRPSIVPGVMAGGVQLLGQAMVPALDMWNTTYNAGVARDIADINANAAIKSGQMGLGAANQAGNSQLMGAGIGAGAAIIGGGLIAL